MLLDKSWTPNEQRDKHLNLCISAVQKGIIKAYSKHRPVRDNLRSEERRTLEELRNDKDIGIKPAGEGGAIVVLGKADYIQEGFRQLSDTNFYEEVLSDPTPEIQHKIKQTQTLLLTDKKITLL